MIGHQDRPGTRLFRPLFFLSALTTAEADKGKRERSGQDFISLLPPLNR